ncbi:hypothetical protein KUCAC02_011523 [Chaenocephalus aceratus]|uniref:Uncharacterized protein n=1 Tax=Chaenocephalus aceratus TaxID=36190 RepID=A0ACB9WW26_CHAAC|nr:hypothetical protein KUCAC02_011523 [Chaenocephalus aceratus]
MFPISCEAHPEAYLRPPTWLPLSSRGEQRPCDSRYTLKIKRRCEAVYARPKSLFYNHINVSESIRLMFSESRIRHKVDKVLQPIEAVSCRPYRVLPM